MSWSHSLLCNSSSYFSLSRHLKLQIVRQREKLEIMFRHYLVEDRTGNDSYSYVDFLCHMHKEIRQLLG